MLKKFFKKKYRHRCGFSSVVGHIVDKAATQTENKIDCRLRIVERTQKVRVGAFYVLPFFLLLVLVKFVPLAAAIEPHQKIYEFNVPALNAAQALNRIAEQTGAIFLYPYNLAKSQQANPVVGKYSLLDALTILLQGTELASGLSDRGIIEISQVDSSNDQGERKSMNKKNKRLATIISFFMGAGGAQQVMGKEEASSVFSLEEIVVTAQKRGEQNLQDVPISIAVLGGDELDAARFDGIAQALNQVAGVNLYAGNQGGGIHEVFTTANWM